MPQPIDNDCPNCGAPLPRAVDGASTCAYCNHLVPVEQRVPMRTRPTPAHASASKAGLGCGLVMGLSLLGLAIGGAILANQLFRGSSAGSDAQSAEPTRKPERSGGRAEYVLWDDVGGPPVPATIVGREAVLGRLRATHQGDQLFVVATDSATLEQRWKAGPYGSYSEGYQSTHFVVVGERVIVSDFRSVLHFLELATGRETSTLSLSDRVECLMVEEGKVRVEQVDKKSLLLDPASKTTTERAKQKRRFRSDDPCYQRESVKRLTLPAESGPTVDGMATVHVFIDGDLGIVSGKKAPGTPIPQVVGFDPKSKDVLWRQLLPNVDPNTVRVSSDLPGALKGRRYVGVYPVGSESHHLTAFDAVNGARQWDIVLRGIFAVDHVDDIVLTEKFVYVVRTSSLDVVSAESGKLIGAIGKETYDDER